MMSRDEEFVDNKEWPWFYCQNLFEVEGQKHIPQKIITRTDLENPQKRYIYLKGAR